MCGRHVAFCWFSGIDPVVANVKAILLVGISHMLGLGDLADMRPMLQC